MASKPSSKRSKQQGTSSLAAGVALGLSPVPQNFGAVVDSGKVKKLCQSVIKKGLSPSVGVLNFQALPDSTQGFEALYCSNPLTKSELPEAKKSTPLIEWFKQDEAIYWLGFRLGLLRRLGASGQYINSVSLMIARSFSGSNPEAVLRAEWAYYADEQNAITPEKETKKHAQPHWHVYNSNLNERASDSILRTLQEEQEETPVVEFNPDNNVVISSVEPKVVVGNFHFAMCAHWSGGHDIVQWPMSENNLSQWLEYCLFYIKSELTPKK